MKLVSSIALVACISLGGCSSFSSDMTGTSAIKQNVDANSASLSLKSTAPCCKTFSEIHYKDFTNVKDNDEVIDGKNDVYAFVDGKSFFTAYKLPANKGNFRITLSSVFTKSVFVPKVMLLDGEYKITRIIDSSAFSFEPAKLLNQNQFSGMFTIDRSHYESIHNETYMIIYTPENTLNLSTTIDSDEMRYARARALSTPRKAKIDIPHSAWGNINIKVDYLSDLNSQNNIYIPESDSNVNISYGENVNLASKPVTADKPAAMLKETENYYNEQIKTAIKHDDIKKAVALYKEAKRLGSPTAEAALVKGLE
jgi:maltose operon periplasmic protein